MLPQLFQKALGKRASTPNEKNVLCRSSWSDATQQIAGPGEHIIIKTRFEINKLTQPNPTPSLFPSSHHHPLPFPFLSFPQTKPPAPSSLSFHPHPPKNFPPFQTAFTRTTQNASRKTQACTHTPLNLHIHNPHPISLILKKLTWSKVCTPHLSCLFEPRNFYTPHLFFFRIKPKKRSFLHRIQRKFDVGKE